jgi:nitrate/TMAO reductase-like tetraheme cytochrome c subunit
MKNNPSRFTRILLLLSVVLLTAFAGQKYYVFKMTEEQAQYHWQNQETIKAFMDQSNLPHNQVKQVIGAIDSLQKDMQRGLSIDSASSKSK